MKLLQRLLLSIFLAVPAGAAEVESVSGRKYPAVLEREIGRAGKSITACLYLFSVNLSQGRSGTMRIVDALARAKARGVKVEVVLDGSREWRGDGEEGAFGKNRGAYDYLAAKGVDVFFSTATSLVHAKAVVFDERSVLAGSSNWTEAAFSRNVEMNLLVRDPAAAGEALEVIRSAGRRRLPEEPEAARLPAAFLTPRFAEKMPDRSFDLYLILLRESQGREEFSISYGRLAAALGITSEPRNQTLRALNGLDKGLVQLTLRKRADELGVKLLPQEGETVGIPAGYWDFGWDRRLPMAGKLSYLVNRLRSERSPMRPRWSASLETLVREHGLSQKMIVNGTTALRRANLLEVEYDELNMTGDGRAPNIYTPRNLYDPAVLDRAWAALEERFGGEKLARARRCAALVYEDSDADVVERFIELEETHGRERVEEAYKVIEAKHPGNPKRSAAYFIAVIQNRNAGGGTPRRGI